MTTQSSLLPISLQEKANGMSNQCICFQFKIFRVDFPGGWMSKVGK